MPERVSDERLAEWLDQGKAVPLQEAAQAVHDLRDARQERDALREAVREAERRILLEKGEGADYDQGIVNAWTILREATKEAIGD